MKFNLGTRLIDTSELQLKVRGYDRVVLETKNGFAVFNVDRPFPAVLPLNKYLEKEDLIRKEYEGLIRYNPDVFTIIEE